MFKLLLLNAFKTRKASVVLVALLSWLARSSTQDFADDNVEEISVHTYMMN